MDCRAFSRGSCPRARKGCLFYFVVCRSSEKMLRVEVFFLEGRDKAPDQPISMAAHPARTGGGRRAEAGGTGPRARGVGEGRREEIVGLRNKPTVCLYWKERSLKTQNDACVHACSAERGIGRDGGRIMLLGVLCHSFYTFWAAGGGTVLNGFCLCYSYDSCLWSYCCTGMCGVWSGVFCLFCLFFFWRMGWKKDGCIGQSAVTGGWGGVMFQRGLSFFLLRPEKRYIETS